jgi:uncharacterized surface protein with fasciclin (FAS1) repeats
MRRAGLATALVATTALAAPAGAGAAQQRDIVRTAAAAGQFETLTSLLRQSGLDRTLKGKGRFTVFAPTDAAFAKVPTSTLEALGADRARLRSVLLYHVARGKLTARRVVKRRAVRTLNGRSVRIRARAGRVTVGGARVVTADVAASNGVVHAIDKVLIPH